MIEVRLEFQQIQTTVHIGKNAWVVGYAPGQTTLPGKRGFVVSDRQVWALYGERFAAAFFRQGLQAIQHLTFRVETGETSKSMGVVESILDRLAELAWAKDETIVGFGGGVVTDLAAFVSAIWKRGTPLVLCPTTLEAQIDAAIGGKCGVNHPAGKNLIGTFHFPERVLIDPACLSTLSDRDYRAGLAESIKHALIADAEFFEWHVANRGAILDRDPKILDGFIARNIDIKRRFVEPDVYETGDQRMLLNFGHTIGHAIETLTTGQLRHGECVSIGMIAAAQVSERAGMVDTSDVIRIRECLSSFGLPITLPNEVTPKALQQVMTQDKKIREGRTKFVLLSGIGRSSLRSDVSLEYVDSVLGAL